MKMTKVILGEDQEREGFHWEMGIKEDLSDVSALRRPGKMDKEIKEEEINSMVIGMSDCEWQWS